MFKVRRKLLAFTQRARVPAGFAMAIALIFAARPTWPLITAGAIIAIFGLALRAWASGHIRKNQELTTSGPYAYTRNPLYLGSFLLGAGISICSGRKWFVALFALLYLAIYFPVMMAEAEALRQLFPSQYEDYSKRVPLFLPRLSPYGSRSRVGFDIKLYLLHREYRSAMGLGLVLALLAAKMHLLK
jgi:protein-S-isoprenylcysteine O-methyltransferase Ste14